MSEFGFVFSDERPGMAVDLKILDKSIQLIDGLEIRVVKDDETLQTWRETVSQGMGLPSGTKNPDIASAKKLGYDFPNIRYLGYWNEKPVSTSWVFFGGGVAGIYGVATLPEARGRGIGSALTIKPLLDARERGYRIGILHSTKMGFNVYKRLGFRHLCQMEYFYLSLT